MNRPPAAYHPEFRMLVRNALDQLITNRVPDIDGMFVLMVDGAKPDDCLLHEARTDLQRTAEANLRAAGHEHIVWIDPTDFAWYVKEQVCN